jgi:ATP-dependent helicase/nuclease subunit A
LSGSGFLLALFTIGVVGMDDILSHLTLSGPQQTAVESRVQDVVVTAGAGTGKTRTLVARYLSLLADGVPLRRIVAITFTRKAAREMRNRVRADIGRYLTRPGLEAETYKRWHGHQNGLDAARIGTIHNLCSEILRNHPAEAGIDPRFNVLDEVQSALLLQDTVEATLARAVSMSQAEDGSGAEMRRLFGLMSEQQLQTLIGTMLYERPSMGALLEGLNPGAVYERWQAQLAEAQAKALERLMTAQDWVESVALLRRCVPVIEADKQVEQRKMVMAVVSEAAGETAAGQKRALAVLNEINLVGGSAKAWAGGSEEMKAVKEALKTVRGLWQGAGILGLALNEQDAAVAAVMPAVYALFDFANRTYAAAKGEREGLDFDDLEGLAVGLLERDAAVRQYWQAQIRALLVDEFQDTNERQRHFIRLLCPEPGKLFIVGDAKQSIYRFRGADVTVFQTERQAIETNGGRAVNLDTSYRAHADLLGSMNRMLRPVLGDDGPERPAYAAPFDPLSPADKGVRAGLGAPFVEFHLALGNKGEALAASAAGLAGRLAALHQESGLDYGDMAILCRASSAFQYYENALDAAGIPYLTVAGKGFYDRPEVRDLLNALQATADPHDDLALAGFLRSPGCGLSDESLYHLAKGRPKHHSLWETIQQGFQLPDQESAERLAWAAGLLGRLHQQAGRTRAADLLKLFLDETNYLAALRLAGQDRALRNVAKLLADVHASELVDAADFLAYAQSLKASGSREGEARSTAGGAVQIMSIHQAKGLEFPVVVLGDAASGAPGRSRSILIDPVMGVLVGFGGENDQKPAAYELGKLLNGAQEAAEVDRLLYVALTRAEQVLMISGHGKLTKTGISWPGWLGQLAAVTGLADCSPDGYDGEGERFVEFDLRGAAAPSRARMYEPKFRPTPSPATVTRPEVQSEQLEKIHHKLEAQFSSRYLVTDDEKRPELVWQVVSSAQRPQAPAWVVGTVVHEAIALGRLPDERFEKWVRARAGSYGLTDERQLADAVRETGRLLKRFQEWELFPEISGAERRFHELPYSLTTDDVIESGFIDLLYRHDGRWTIVDFKTDDIGSGAGVREFLERERYTVQIRRYGRAVIKLLGERPRLLICLLNGRNGVVTESVSLE